MRSLLLVLLAGCWSSSSPPAAVPTQAALPACPIELVDQHLRVAGADLGPFLDEPEAGTDRLAIYQTGDEAWVSYRAAHERGGPEGSDTLWKVSCAGKKLDQLTIEGADFGHAALHPDRTRLYFSSPSVVVELELATKRRTAITKPSTIESCWIAPTDEPFPLRDVVVAATADYVELERGNSCGFEADWEATLVRYHFASKREELATPISAVVQAGTAVLIAVAHNCMGQVLRSVDLQTWTPVSTNLTGPITLVADGDVILAASQNCSVASNGAATVSRDGGKTWTPIADAVAIQATRGSTLATFEIYGQSDERWRRWNGTSFVATSTQDDRVPAPSRTVKLRDRTVEMTTFGLVDAETREKLYPR